MTQRLLEIASLRPLAEYGRTTLRTPGRSRTSKSRATWRKSLLTANTITAAAVRGRSAVQPEMAERLELQGWEQALTDELLLTTGMRKGELASLTIADVDLCDDAPTVTFRGIHAKNGKRATIPLRPDVAIHVRDWLADRRRRLAAQGNVLAADDRLVQIPSGLIRILDRDLAAAGISKVDERGRRLDVTKAVSLLPAPSTPTPDAGVRGFDGGRRRRRTNCCTNLREAGGFGGLCRAPQSIGRKIHPREEGQEFT